MNDNKAKLVFKLGIYILLCGVPIVWFQTFMYGFSLSYKGPIWLKIFTDFDCAIGLALMGFGYFVSKMKQIYVPLVIFLFSIANFALYELIHAYLNGNRYLVHTLDLSTSILIIFYIVIAFKGIKYFGDMESNNEAV